MLKSSFDEDMNRGYLETGEPLEARWGAGPWSGMPEQYEEINGPEPAPGECPFCKEEAIYVDGIFYECQRCGKNFADIEYPKES